ncbi:MAG: MFS transporter [Candidatus Marinimicrobia bacterium]|nr:MFS transporter [Candidatus Neomarinimicrobiota bacterium]
MSNSRSAQAKKTVTTFALASFLNDLGSDIIYPIWPLFVTSVLGANMAVLGLIDGLGEAVVSISKALSGYISDKTKKRKIFIWTGYLMGAISRIGYALSTVWPHLIPFRILDRAGKIRSAPRDAIVADISTPKTRGKIFGLLRSADHLGAVFGILICIFFFNILGYRLLFAMAAVPSLVGAFLIIRNINEAKPPARSPFETKKASKLDRNFILFLILSAVFAIGSFSYSFLMIYAKEFGFRVSFVPVLYLVYSGTASLSAMPFGKLADRIGRKAVMMIAFLLWILVGLTVVFTQHYTAVVVIFVLFGMHKGAIEPVQKAFVSDIAPVELRASYLGTYQMVIGLCALPASLIAGLLWDNIGVNMPFIVSIGLAGSAMGLLIFIRSND